VCFAAGEVALPGGKADEGDKDDGETATREAKEEIGLDPSLVDVVTVLEPFLSKVSASFFLFFFHLFKPFVLCL
jgi:8-oxo-dGTP pyrophosphatase MutT (NUDIX family)